MKSKTPLNRKAQKIALAICQVAIEEYAKGKPEVATKIKISLDTLTADPEILNRIGNILFERKKK